MPVKIGGIDYLRAPEAAEYADVTVDTIAFWCRHNKITCTKSSNNRWLIDKLSLERFLQGNSHADGDNRDETK